MDELYGSWFLGQTRTRPKAKGFSGQGSEGSSINIAEVTCIYTPAAAGDHGGWFYGKKGELMLCQFIEVGWTQCQGRGCRHWHLDALSKAGCLHVPLPGRPSPCTPNPVHVHMQATTP